MKFKIPEIKIKRPRRTAEHDSEPPVNETDDVNDAEEILDELELSHEEPEQPDPVPEKPQSRGMEISESQLRSVWAGEIGFGLVMALAAVIIALIN